MLRTLLVALSLTAVSVVASAQEDVINERQAIFKSFGRVSRDPGLMLRDQAPFDLAKVKAALETFADGSSKLPNLFPEASKTGKTDALPAIWEDKARFSAIFAKFSQDSQAALVSIKDEGSFTAEFPKVLGNCGTCHQSFRAKR
jgi:cytochrome c556